MQNKKINTHNSLDKVDYFNGSASIYDKDSGLNIIKIISGDYYVSKDPKDVFVTILGSCISACIYDEVLKIGGMNHFLLPGDGTTENARFGSFAMELTINDMLKLGSSKRRMKVKLYGGANVLATNSSRIGDKNIEFIKHFVKNEQLNIVEQDLGGTLPRRLHFFPAAGVVEMRKIEKQYNKQVIEEENSYANKLNKQKTAEAASDDDDDIELF